MRFTVSAPASSANLGPGFDALGMALNLWNRITIDTDGPAGVVRTSGSEAAVLEGRENLSLTAMADLAARHGRMLPPFSLDAEVNIPVARGLGSSASALVAGLVAANRLLDLNLSDDDLYEVAWEMEGHGDNVGAALYGGAVLAVPGHRGAVRLLTERRVPLAAVVFVPDTTAATVTARAALPEAIPMRDAAHNLATTAGLAVGLMAGDPVLISHGMHDRLHEPYRAAMFPHLPPMAQAARAAGALGAVLSGAGPTILALSLHEQSADVAAALSAVAGAHGVPGTTSILLPMHEGYSITEA